MYPRKQKPLTALNRYGILANGREDGQVVDLADVIILGYASQGCAERVCLGVLLRLRDSPASSSSREAAFTMCTTSHSQLTVAAETAR